MPASLRTQARATLKPARKRFKHLRNTVRHTARFVRTTSREAARSCLAHLRRPRLKHVTFVGVTGSCGKTTTTQLIGAVLSTAGKTVQVSGLNGYRQLVETVLSLEPRTRYCAHEMSGSWPGRLAPQVRLLRPAIGVVTVIGTDHYKNFRGKEATAREKGRLVELLPAHATAILNADDPYVLAMRDRTRARVLTVGRSADCDLRAVEVSSAWPERLRLTVVHDRQSLRLSTQLVGEWWTTSVLAAVACGLICGLELETCAEAIEGYEPDFGRYSVHPVPGSATYIFDHKAVFGTIANALAFMAAAHATRKTIVFGTIADYPGAASPRYRRVAREALDAADRVIFTGPGAGHVTKLAQGPLRERLLSFDTTYQASEFLRAETVPGELVLLKGSMGADHLERIILSQLDQVVCWRDGCGRLHPCPECKDYRLPFPPAPYAVRHSGALEVSEALS